jgi:kumamolisin
LSGSEPTRRPESESVSGTPPLEQTIQVTVIARAHGAKALVSAVSEMATLPPHQRRHLSHEEFRQRFGARQEVLERIAAAASELGLEVADLNPAGRSATLRGTVAQMCRIFRVEPVLHRRADGTYRSFKGPIQVPEQLASDIEAVIGLDDIPVAVPHVCRHLRTVDAYTHPAEIARLYDFPEADGAGQRVAIIELGGGFHEADLDLYFAEQGLAKPTIVVHELDGARNNPADAEAILATIEAAGISVNYPAMAERAPADDPRNSAKNINWTVETSMDIELVGALVPRAEIHVYFAANNTNGKYHALRAALEDDCSVISLSWSGHESDKSPSYIDLIESVLHEAALKGVTVCCASGDDGRLVYPASSPYALACGGTHLHDTETGAVHEKVWNEAVPVPAARRMCSGGGVSEVFDLPSWQESADVVGKTGLSGRGTPDVAAKADLHTGYYTVVGGSIIGGGGTSAAAPTWASLVTRINQHLAENGSRIGYLTPLLYVLDRVEVFRDIAGGHSGIYQACSGWDPCTGLGSPNGSKLLEWLLP